MQRIDAPSRGWICRRNARNCTLLAADADTEFNRRRLLVMAEAWQALADAEDWLAGHVPPESGDDGPALPAAPAALGAHTVAERPLHP